MKIHSSFHVLEMWPSVLFFLRIACRHDALYLLWMVVTDRSVAAALIVVEQR